jgi:hypothetical protein
MSLQAKTLQRYANRFLKAGKKPLLVCDGDIGANTVGAINGILGGPVDKAGIVNNLDKYVSDIKWKAGLSFLWADVPCPKSKTTSGGSTIVNIPEYEMPVPAQAGFMSASFGGVPLWMIGLGVVGVVYVATKKKKK